MTSDELKAIKERIGWDWSQLARELHVDLATLWRWRNDRSPIPGVATVALQALADGWRPQP